MLLGHGECEPAATPSAAQLRCSTDRPMTGGQSVLGGASQVRVARQRSAGTLTPLGSRSGSFPWLQTHCCISINSPLPTSFLSPLILSSLFQTHNECQPPPNAKPQFAFGGRKAGKPPSRSQPCLDCLLRTDRSQHV